MSDKKESSQKHDKSYEDPDFKTDSKTDETLDIIEKTAKKEENPEESPLESDKDYDPDEVREKVITASDEELEKASDE